MSLAAALLPENLDEPQVFAASLQSEPYAKTLHIEKPKAQLAAPRRARFGRSSEKADREIEQIELALGDLEEPCGKGGAIETRHATEIDRRICSLEDGWIGKVATQAPQRRINHQSPMPTVVRRERPSWRGKPFDGGCPVKRSLVGLKRTRSSEEVGSGG